MTDQPWSTRPWNDSESTPEPTQVAEQDADLETPQDSDQESGQEFDLPMQEDVAVDVPAEEASTPPQSLATEVVTPAAPWYASAIATSVDEPERESADGPGYAGLESDDHDGASASRESKVKGSKKKGKAKQSRDAKALGKAAKVKGEKRVALTVKIPKSLRTSLVREAKQKDLSVGELLAAYLPDRMNH